MIRVKPGETINRTPEYLSPLWKFSSIQVDVTRVADGVARQPPALPGVVVAIRAQIQSRLVVKVVAPLCPETRQRIARDRQK